MGKFDDFYSAFYVENGTARLRSSCQGSQDAQGPRGGPQASAPEPNVPQPGAAQTSAPQPNNGQTPTRGLTSVPGGAQRSPELEPEALGTPGPSSRRPRLRLFTTPGGTRRLANISRTPPIIRSAATGPYVLTEQQQRAATNSFRPSARVTLPRLPELDTPSFGSGSRAQGTFVPTGSSSRLTALNTHGGEDRITFPPPRAPAPRGSSFILRPPNTPGSSSVHRTLGVSDEFLRGYGAALLVHGVAGHSGNRREYDVPTPRAPGPLPAAPSVVNATNTNTMTPIAAPAGPPRTFFFGWDNPLPPTAFDQGRGNREGSGNTTISDPTSVVDEPAEDEDEDEMDLYEVVPDSDEEDYTGVDKTTGEEVILGENGDQMDLAEVSPTPDKAHTRDEAPTRDEAHTPDEAPIPNEENITGGDDRTHRHEPMNQNPDVPAPSPLLNFSTRDMRIIPNSQSSGIDEDTKLPAGTDAPMTEQAIPSADNTSNENDSGKKKKKKSTKKSKNQQQDTHTTIASTSTPGPGSGSGPGPSTHQPISSSHGLDGPSYTPIDLPQTENSNQANTPGTAPLPIPSTLGAATASQTPPGTGKRKTSMRSYTTPLPTFHMGLRARPSSRSGLRPIAPAPTTDTPTKFSKVGSLPSLRPRFDQSIATSGAPRPVTGSGTGPGPATIHAPSFDGNIGSIPTGHLGPNGGTLPGFRPILPAPAPAPAPVGNENAGPRPIPSASVSGSGSAAAPLASSNGYKYGYLPGEIKGPDTRPVVNRAVTPPPGKVHVQSWAHGKEMAKKLTAKRAAARAEAEAEAETVAVAEAEAEAEAKPAAAAASGAATGTVPAEAATEAAAAATGPAATRGTGRGRGRGRGRGGGRGGSVGAAPAPVPASGEGPELLFPNLGRSLGRGSGAAAGSSPAAGPGPAAGAGPAGAAGTVGAGSADAVSAGSASASASVSGATGAAGTRGPRPLMPAPVPATGHPFTPASFVVSDPARVVDPRVQALARGRTPLPSSRPRQSDPSPHQPAARSAVRRGTRGGFSGRRRGGRVDGGLGEAGPSGAVVGEKEKEKKDE